MSFFFFSLFVLYHNVCTILLVSSLPVLYARLAVIARISLPGIGGVSRDNSTKANMNNIISILRLRNFWHGDTVSGELSTNGTQFNHQEK